MPSAVRRGARIPRWHLTESWYVEEERHLITSDGDWRRLHRNCLLPSLVCSNVYRCISLSDRDMSRTIHAFYGVSVRASLLSQHFFAPSMFVRSPIRSFLICALPGRSCPIRAFSARAFLICAFPVCSFLTGAFLGRDFPVRAFLGQILPRSCLPRCTSLSAPASSGPRDPLRQSDAIY